MVMRVALIGCGKSKRAEPCAARDIYTGQLFRAALAHAEATADRVFILSAKLGLVRLTEQVAPYNLKLSAFNKREREAWGSRAAGQLIALVGTDIDVSVYAGRDYAQPVTAALLSRRYAPRPVVIPVTQPLEGLQVGQRLAWFKARRAAA